MTTLDDQVVIPDRIRRPSTDLISALARRAGDLDAGMEAFDEVLIDVKPDDRTAVIVGALLIVFAECITQPTESHDDPVPVDLTAATNQGENE